jgi:hypothetical protein
MHEDEPLTADEVLTFGPCVEAQVWTPIWLQESRAPSAVAAGRARLGRVFNDDGVGQAVLIRPCMSRGRRLRGLAPIYTPQMLERHSDVFNGWPMFTDHVPAEVQEALVKRGRSVKELGGQVLTGRWQRDYVHEEDPTYGYRQGAVVADIWARPMIREMVDNNPNLLHTSINAWPTSGRPAPCPWRPSVKGMVIEGIRRQPQGSVDYVVRPGAGGRLLLAEAEDEGAWPAVGEWSEEDRRFVVSVAKRLYDPPQMELTLPTEPEALREWLDEHAPHLLPALAEQNMGPDMMDNQAPPFKKKKKKGDDGEPDADDEKAVTEADVVRLIEVAAAGIPSVQEFETQMAEQVEMRLAERESQRKLSEVARGLIDRAEGIPELWKADLRERYTLLPSGPTTMLLVEGEQADEQGNPLSAEKVIEARVRGDLDHVRLLVQEARGRPRVTGHGGAAPDPQGDRPGGKREVPYWRQEFVGMRLAESTDKAGEIFGQVSG